jgi:putative hydrolase of HD superfamily
MEEIHKFRKIYKLKSVYRACSVDDRKESTAEHVWSALILAKYIMDEYPSIKLDKLKVLELLMYHDLVEIYAGDTVLHPMMKVTKEEKYAIEKASFDKLYDELPEIMSKKYSLLFHEYENSQTRESLFAHAIDALDAILQELDYKDDWKGWNENFLKEKKEKYFIEFPELLKIFTELLDYMKKEGYFDQ